MQQSFFCCCKPNLEASVFTPPKPQHKSGLTWIIYGSINLKIVFWALHTMVHDWLKGESKQ